MESQALMDDEHVDDHMSPAGMPPADMMRRWKDAITNAVDSFQHATEQDDKKVVPGTLGKLSLIVDGALLM